jgi:hypothetical protein
MPTPDLESLARHLREMNALADARLAAAEQPDKLDAFEYEPKLDVFAGTHHAYTQPVCVYCGAPLECDCYESRRDSEQANAHEGRCSRLRIDP